MNSLQIKSLLLAFAFALHIPLFSGDNDNGNPWGMVVGGAIVLVGGYFGVPWAYNKLYPAQDKKKQDLKNNVEAKKVANQQVVADKIDQKKAPTSNSAEIKKEEPKNNMVSTQQKVTEQKPVQATVPVPVKVQLQTTYPSVGKLVNAVGKMVASPLFAIKHEDNWDNF